MWPIVTKARAPALEHSALQSCILPSPCALVLALRLGSTALGIMGYPSSLLQISWKSSFSNIYIYQAIKQIKKDALICS